ncbi:MAG: nicotinate (nicotinamide) nucleotide adenylyltransferase [Betaproteobacteria bacterium]|nr:nicotinate (nicotinamide) nucleotide adenylyltransferase [Betaproteobacteria bacterium]
MTAAPTGPVAILGGTFDPVHNAHLAIAARAFEALGARRVLWMPTGAPGYRRAPVAPAEHRLAMLRLALAGEPRYAIDARELAPGHSGYTYDTLAALRAELGERTPLVMLIGGDQYARLAGWHRWKELFGFARFAVFARPGEGAGPQDAPAGGVVHVPLDPMPQSASTIRARLARGESVAGLLPAAVIEYIQLHRLYH